MNSKRTERLLLKGVNIVGYWIKTDGMVVEVQPANGKEFTSDELHRMVGGYLDGFVLGVYHNEVMHMFVLDDFEHAPFNILATMIVDFTEENWMRPIFGNVVIASQSEIGE